MERCRPSKAVMFNKHICQRQWWQGGKHPAAAHQQGMAMAFSSGTQATTMAGSADFRLLAEPRMRIER